MAWQPGRPLRLTTPRFMLRSLRPDAPLDPILAWAEDAEVAEMLNLAPGALDADELRRYLAGFDNRRSFGLGVYPRAEAAPIGFYAVYCDPRQRMAATNVVIGERAWWGKGVVLETRAALLDFLFGALGMDKVMGTPLARNFAAIYNYKAQGFRCEAVMRRHRLTPTGERVDQLVFAMLREEWLARRQAGS